MRQARAQNFFDVCARFVFSEREKKGEREREREGEREGGREREESAEKSRALSLD